MIITHKLEMDLAERGTVQRIEVVQGDCNSRVLELTLLSGGEAWTVPEDASVRLRYCKSDGTRGIYDTLPDGSCAWTAEENVVTVALAPQVLTAAGLVLAQVELIHGADVLATFAVPIGVERNLAAGMLHSEDYINMLSWMEDELDKRLAEAKESGEFDGPQGAPGEPGADVFDYAVEAGYPGTEAEFREMLITPCLPLSGGVMSGAVQMGGQALSGLAWPESATDAATKSYVDTRRVFQILTLTVGGWSETAPYTQLIRLNTVKMGDWLRLEPIYTGTLETDLAMKRAFDCISYVSGEDYRVRAVCLEKKPEIDLPVYLEAVR